LFQPVGREAAGITLASTDKAIIVVHRMALHSRNVWASVTTLGGEIAPLAAFEDVS
jgi:hypothetical protein